MLTDIANPTIRLKWLLTQKGLQALIARLQRAPLLKAVPLRVLLALP